MENTASSQNSVVKNEYFIVAANFFSSFGNQVFKVLLPLIILAQTNSAQHMANLRATEFLPNLLFAYLLGILVDRYNKKLFLLCSHILQMMLVAFLAYYLFVGATDLSTLYIATFMYMLFAYANGNLTASIIKVCIPKDRVLSVNTNLSSVSSILEIVAPFIAGVALALSNYVHALVFVIAMLAISIMSFYLVDIEEIKTPRNQANTSFYEDFKEGFRILLAHKDLLNITLVTMLFNTGIGFVYALLVYYCKEMYQYTDSEIGYIFSFIGIFTLLGSRFAKVARKKIGLGKMMCISVLSISVAYLMMGLFDSKLVFIGGIGIASFFTIIFAIGVWSYRIESTPKEVIGKITGITGSLFKVGMPLSAIFSGVLVVEYSLSAMFYAASAMMVLLTLICFYRGIHRIA